MKRIFLLILSFSHFLCSSVTAQDVSISTAAELKAFADDVNVSNDYRGKTVVLTADIDLTDYPAWTPISPFAGTFDGGGYSISNLNADGNTGMVAGLFGTVSSTGIVKDVHIMSGSSLISTNEYSETCYIGSIVGYNAGKVVGCSNRARVMGYGWDSRTGGIVGENASGGVVQNCYNLGEVSNASTNVHIGGIVGNNNGIVQNCFMKASVIKNSDSAHPKAYPISGNNELGGSVTGCFYAGGAAEDATVVVSLADAGDNSSMLATNAGQTKNLLLNGRTLFADSDWNTLCLPFTISAGASGYSPIAGATVMSLSNSELSGGTLTLTFENATSIVAGKPYIVKWDTPIAGNLENPVFLNVSVNDATNNVTSTYADFVGTYSPLRFDDEDNTKLFLGANNYLYYPNGERATTINSFRAYFQLNGIMAGATGSVKAFVLDFGEDATGMAQLFPLRSSPSGFYSLDGRHLSGKPLQPGIYISNGRKVVIK